MLTDIGRQARNKIEKHDHQTREAATRLAERLTPQEQSELAAEGDVHQFRQRLAAVQLRLATAAADQAKAVLDQPAAPPPPAEAATDAPTGDLDDEESTELESTSAEHPVASAPGSAPVASPSAHEDTPQEPGAPTG